MTDVVHVKARVEYVAIADVIIDSKRFRPPRNTAGLAASLRRFGLLQPIVLNSDMTLVAGCRRITAAKEAGWTHIDANFKEELDEITRRELELEENIQREDMTVIERQRAIAELHRLKMLQNPDWTGIQTAAVASVHPSDVSKALKITKMAELFPEIAKAKTTSEALKMAQTKAKAIGRVQDVKANPGDYSAVEERVILGDSVEVIKTVPSESIHLVLTDPPFGINYENIVSPGVSVTSYKDDLARYEHLLSMAPDLYRVIKPNGWLVWFLGHDWYEVCKKTFEEVGFKVDPIPLVWDRSDGPTFTANGRHFFPKGYDIALHCVKGDPCIIKVRVGQSNIIRIPGIARGERDLVAERPVELYEEIIKRLTIPGETVADFFAGSGSCPAAAAKLNRPFFAVELDATRRAAAVQKIKAHSISAA